MHVCRTAYPEEIPLLVTCDGCDGAGVRGWRVWVYEHGCAFGHYDTDEEVCEACEGAGAILVDSEPAGPDWLREDA